MFSRESQAALKGRNLNSLAFQRQAGIRPPFRPEGAVLFSEGLGSAPFRAERRGRPVALALKHQAIQIVPLQGGSNFQAH